MAENANNKRLDEIVERLDQIAELYALKNNQSEFAKAFTRLIVFNPSKTTTNAQTYQKYNREQILRWLQNPANNEKNLRNASIYFYLSSMHYQRLIAYYAKLPLWQYVIYPKVYDPTVKIDNVKKQYYKVAEILKAMSIPQVGSIIATTVLRDGIYFGVRHLGRGGCYIQRLNPDICRIAYIQEGVPLFKVDMSKIPKDQLEFYPPQFERMYSAYEKEGQKWQDVPEDISVCIKFDLSTIEYSIPPFAAILPGLYKISDAEDRHDVSANQRNIKMIFATAPIKEDGSPAMDFDLFVKYYQHLANQLPEEIGLGASPFKMEAVDFYKNTTADIDDVARTTSNFWASAGTSPLLHGTVSETAGTMKLAIKSDESFVSDIVAQIERAINAYLELEVGGKIIFNIKILPTTIFNIDEYVARYKEGATLGIGKLYYMAALDIPQADFEGINIIENQVLELDKKLTPLKSSYNSGSDKSGRPQKKDEDLQETGENTKETDQNENRV